MLPVSIRYATAADVALVADISRRTFYDTFAVYNTPEDMDLFMKEQFADHQVAAELADPSNTFLLAFTGDELAGYACLRESANPEVLGDIPAVEIGRLYASQQTIGKGIGSTLMQQCIDIARQKQKTAIWLGVWEKNERAIAFYTRWGFERIGDHEFVLGTDVQTDWLMKKAV
jgi:diamine N-acetyltransferase